MIVLKGPVNKSPKQKWKEYVRIDLESWNLLKDGTLGRFIEPVPYTGELDEFTAEIKNEHVEEQSYYPILQSHRALSPWI